MFRYLEASIDSDYSITIETMVQNLKKSSVHWKAPGPVGLINAKG